MTGELGQRALRFVEAVSAAAWDQLTPLVSADDFVLVGRDKQGRDRAQTIAAAEQWVRAAAFDYEVRRLEEVGALVFLQLGERGPAGVLDTMTVFEFDTAGRIRRIDAFQ